MLRPFLLGHPVYLFTHDIRMLLMCICFFLYLPVFLWKTAWLTWIVEAALGLEGVVTDFLTFKFIADCMNTTDARLLRCERHVMVWRQEKKNKWAEILNRQNFYLSNKLTCAPHWRCDKKMQIHGMEPTLKTLWMDGKILKCVLMDHRYIVWIVWPRTGPIFVLLWSMPLFNVFLTVHHELSIY